MTRVTGLLVVLREPMREDEVETAIQLVQLLRPVIEVRPVEGDLCPKDHDDEVERARGVAEADSLKGNDALDELPKLKKEFLSHLPVSEAATIYFTVDGFGWTSDEAKQTIKALGKTLQMDIAQCLGCTHWCADEPYHWPDGTVTKGQCFRHNVQDPTGYCYEWEARS